MAAHHSSQPILDHIVILVSQTTLLATPALLKDHLVVSPGGEHAGGLTNNKLILFQDGVYIELIAFYEDVDPSERRSHRWGESRENTIVDWAYTLPREEDFGAVQQRVREAGAGIEYADPVPGGRTRPDGTVLRWAIGAARGARPGSVPFWCLDRTPRGLRVPYEGRPEATEHPAGVSGVLRLRVAELEGEVDACGRVLDAVHGGAGPGREREWGVGVPAEEAMRVSRRRHTVGVSGAAGEDGVGIELTLSGTASSPSSIEIAPGLVVKVEVE